jgi:hypothetical protein
MVVCAVGEWGRPAPTRSCAPRVLLASSSTWLIGRDGCSPSRSTPQQRRVPGRLELDGSREEEEEILPWSIDHRHGLLLIPAGPNARRRREEAASYSVACRLLACPSIEAGGPGMPDQES